MVGHSGAVIVFFFFCGTGAVIVAGPGTWASPHPCVFFLLIDVFITTSPKKKCIYHYKCLATCLPSTFPLSTGATLGAGTGPIFSRSTSSCWIGAIIATRFGPSPSAQRAPPALSDRAHRAPSNRPTPTALLHNACAPRGCRHRHGLQVTTSLHSSPLLLSHTLHISSSIDPTERAMKMTT